MWKSKKVMKMKELEARLFQLTERVHEMEDRARFPIYTSDGRFNCYLYFPEVARLLFNHLEVRPHLPKAVKPQPTLIKTEDK